MYMYFLSHIAVSNITYLRKGVHILSVEVVQWLMNPGLLDLLERLMTAGHEVQEELLVVLQLELSCTLFDFSQNTPF